MLPGFRILCATTVLAISILVFGLGAAALLRAAHEEFASLPSWRLAQQPPLTPQVPRPEITPVLAMLRIEAPGTKPLPETLRREVALPEPAPQQPAASQVMPAEVLDTKPAETTVTPDNGSAVAEPDEAASTPVTDQVATLNAPQPGIEPPAKPVVPGEEANGPDVKTPDVTVPESKVIEPAQPPSAETPAEPKASESKVSELKASESKPAESSDARPSPPKPQVTEASEPLSTLASIERSSEATASATEPKPVVKRVRRPSARAIAQRRQAARARAEARAQAAERLRQQQNPFPLFGGG